MVTLARETTHNVEMYVKTVNNLPIRTRACLRLLSSRVRLLKLTTRKTNANVITCITRSKDLESILWGEVFWAQTPQEREFPHEFESKKIFEIRPLEIYVTGVQSSDHVTRAGHVTHNAPVSWVELDWPARIARRSVELNSAEGTCYM